MNQNPGQQPQQPIYVINRENSGWAIASLVFGILGILGLDICGGFVLIIAFGHIALSQIRNSNGTIGGRGVVRNLLISLAIAAALFPADGFAQTPPDQTQRQRLEQRNARTSPPNMLNESESAVERQAVADVNRLSFEELLARRAAELTEPARRFYERELRERPEMKEARILAGDDPRQIAIEQPVCRFVPGMPAARLDQSAGVDERGGVARRRRARAGARKFYRGNASGGRGKRQPAAALD